jgi:prephenate dehydratase
LGGSIHINFDLLLRYDLHIIAEHDFRVQHSLLALPGVKKEDIKKVLSHPQALAQCDNYLRIWGVDREDSYDTAGSAKIIKEKDLKNCAAIASDLAG